MAFTSIMTTELCTPQPPEIRFRPNHKIPIRLFLDERLGRGKTPWIIYAHSGNYCCRAQVPVRQMVSR
jgi:hypothetical protein